MADLLDEVKRDIKEERAIKLWAKYSNIFLAFMILIVIATAIYVYYKDSKQQKLETLGSKLHKFNEVSIKSPERIDQLYGELEDESYKASSAYKLLKANKLLEQGKIKESQNILVNVFSDENNPIEIREVAGITYATNFSNDKSDEIVQKIASSDGPFKLSAQELKAYGLFDEKKYEEALTVFKEIQENEATPTNMKNRVTEAVNYIEAKFVVKPKAEELEEENKSDTDTDTKQAVTEESEVAKAQDDAEIKDKDNVDADITDKADADVQDETDSNLTSKEESKAETSDEK